MEIYVANYSISISDSFAAQFSFPEVVRQSKYSSVLVLADTHTAQFCYPLIKEYLPEHHLIIIPPGESEKHIETCKYLWEEFTRLRAERASLLINLGGGVIGDMGGFVASTYKRGFDFMNIPTTLLSMVDASVGGKLGIDFNGIKNLIGVFTDPKDVFINAAFLQTLPFEQLRSGFAEVIKHGLIADETYFNSVKNISLQEANDWHLIIARSVEIKKQVVEKDPYEAGWRKILNFGHTVGHAVEAWSLQNDEQPLLHGEAIAIGMICEAWLSHATNGLSEAALNEISNTIFRYFEKYSIEKIPASQLIEYMRLDKKNSQSHIQFSLLNSIGNCDFNCQATDEQINASILFYSGL